MESTRFVTNVPQDFSEIVLKHSVRATPFRAANIIPMSLSLYFFRHFLDTILDFMIFFWIFSSVLVTQESAVSKKSISHLSWQSCYVSLDDLLHGGHVTVHPAKLAVHAHLPRIFVNNLFYHSLSFWTLSFSFSFAHEI